MSARFQRSPIPDKAPNPQKPAPHKAKAEEGEKAPPTNGGTHKKPGPKPFLVDLDAVVSTGGRPMPQRDLILQLGRICSNVRELAACLNMSQSTLYEVFERQPEVREMWERAKDQGRAGLRGRLFQLAEKNVGAAIFLAKNELGMRDQFDLQQNVNVSHNVLVAVMERLDGKVGKQIEEPPQSGTQTGAGKLIEHSPSMPVDNGEDR